MNTYQPYTYLIGWSVHNLWYYGVRFAKNCHPGDLWVTYFTSSKYVAALREQHGEPDVVQVRKLFSSAEVARQWEHKVLRRMRAVESESWINRHDAHHHFYNVIPCNKILTTFEHVCEFCGRKTIRHATQANLSRKTCGSKSCAQKWTCQNIDRSYTKYTEVMTVDERKAKFGRNGHSNGFYGKRHSLELQEQITRKISGNYTIHTPDGEVNDINNLFRYCKEHNLNRDILMKHIDKGPVPAPVYRTNSVSRHNTTGYTIKRLA